MGRCVGIGAGVWIATRHGGCRGPGRGGHRQLGGHRDERKGQLMGGAVELAGQLMPLLVMYAAIRTDLALLVRRVGKVEDRLTKLEGKNHGKEAQVV